MHRIDTEGTAGTFTDGNPQYGQQGTLIDETFFLDVQEAICNPIEHAGIALVKGDPTQLTDAIIAIAQGVGGGGVGAGAVPTTRLVQGGGLVTGGHALDQDVTLTVAKASVADLVAGQRDDATATPLALAGLFGAGGTPTATINLPGGIILKLGGYDAFINGEGLYHIAFPEPFPNGCLRAFLQGINATGGNTRDIWPQLTAKTKNGLDFFAQWTGNSGTQQTLDGVDYWAFGY